VPIPSIWVMMWPLLELAGDKQEHYISEASDYVAERLELSDQERNELLPSGQQRRLDNKISFALLHLTKADLLETTKTTHFRITQRGLNVLKKKPDKIDNHYLDQFPEYREFRKGKGKNKISEMQAQDDSEQPPTVIIENAYQELREDLARQLLDAIMEQSPVFFERLVVVLLVAMGYGGSIKDAGEAVGKSGDGGIDGIIKEDKLGVERIYIQAKRRGQGTVGSPDLQKFVGALTKKNAKKGVFITTSTFTPDARAFVDDLSHNVALIDGKELTKLMIDYDIGVNKDAVYEIKKIDSDFFSGS
jgi:restriction system protein